MITAPRTYEVAFVRNDPLNVWVFKRKVGANAEHFAADCRAGSINYIMIKNRLYSITEVKETVDDIMLKLSEDVGIIYALTREMHGGYVDSTAAAYNMIYVLGYKFR
jgi:hypothetical protein